MFQFHFWFHLLQRSTHHNLYIQFFEDPSFLPTKIESFELMVQKRAHIVCNSKDIVMQKCYYPFSLTLFLNFWSIKCCKVYTFTRPLFFLCDFLHLNCLNCVGSVANLFSSLVALQPRMAELLQL